MEFKTPRGTLSGISSNVLSAGNALLLDDVGFSETWQWRKRILKINSHVIYFFLETLLAIFQKLNFSSADLYVLA